MNLSEICVKRPVLSIVLSLIIVLIGLVSWNQLTVRQYPRIEKPVISVSVDYHGSGPEIIESLIVKPIESALGGIEGVDVMQSRCEQDSGRVNLRFNVSRDIEHAASDVRDKLGRVRLPDDAEKPRVYKTDSDAQPIIYLVLYSDKIPVRDIFDYAERNVETSLEVMAGVARIDTLGSGGYAMEIVLDPVRMAAYHVTPQDVHSAIRRANIEKPAGRLRGDKKEFIVSTVANLKTPEEYNNLVILEKKGALVRIKDVGYARLNSKNTKSKIYYNGQNAIGLGIVIKSTGNPLEIASQLEKKLPELRANLPSGMSMEVAYDTTIFIDRSIKQVYSTIFEATVLVILVIYGFLRSFRAVLIPLVTIPVSLITSFALIYLFGFSINILTLLAMVLAIGLVVDDAIVVLENIYRYIEEGMDPHKASIKGIKEITFAVIAMTLTLAAVYAPIAFSTGMSGKLFREFALTLAGAVIISGFVALTLSPMMCAKLLKNHMSSSMDHHKTGKKGWLDQLDSLYGRWVQVAVEKRNTVVIWGLLVSLLGYVVGAYYLPRELSPAEDKGIIYARAQGSQGATLENIDKYTQQINNILQDVPEIEKQFTMINVPEVTSMNLLTPWEDRKRSSSEIVASLRPQLKDVTGLRAYPSLPKSFTGGGSDTASVELVIQSNNRSYQEIKKVAEKMMAGLEYLGSQTGLFTQVTGEIGGESQDFMVKINRDRLAALGGATGTDPETIANTIESLMGNKVSSKLKINSKEYDVRIDMEDENRRSPHDISGFFIRGKDDAMIPLSDVVEIIPRTSPVEIQHFNKMRAVGIHAELAEGASQGEAVALIQEVADKILPDDVFFEFSGQTREFLNETQSMFIIFGLALAFIYLVLAAQFESFIDPFIIMLSVPLSITGGVLALKLSGVGSLNIFSQIGMISLIGLITKHGILIVEFANKLKEEGMSASKAVIEASRLRLRPILMTTFAMVLGAIPLAFSTGPGAESRQQIGLVIVGGMTLGTLLTLFVVPAVYTYLTRKKTATD